MTIRQLAQILLSLRDLDQDVKISFQGNRGNDITSISFDDDVITLGASGYNEDRLSVRSEVEVTSPYSDMPQIF